jgi:hypothetical protein
MVPPLQMLHPEFFRTTPSMLDEQWRFAVFVMFADQ